MQVQPHLLNWNYALENAHFHSRNVGCAPLRSRSCAACVEHRNQSCGSRAQSLARKTVHKPVTIIYLVMPFPFCPPLLDSELPELPLTLTLWLLKTLKSSFNSSDPSMQQQDKNQAFCRVKEATYWRERVHGFLCRKFSIRQN